MTERKSLESERAELVALADRIETHINYGTSIIIHLSDQKTIASALRRLAAQDRKPVAKIECHNCHNANKYGDYEGPTCDVCLGDGFVSPPPAAGWGITDDMVADAHAEYHKVLGDKNRSDPMRAALTAALRHNAPPDSGAGKVSACACLQPGDDPLRNCEICDPPPSVMPDHGGADAGVGVKPLEWGGFRAETPFGYYHIDDQTDRSAEELKGRDPFLLSGSRIDLSRHSSLVSAKAAAQADYERRILSALSKPAPVVAIDPRWRTELDDIIGHLGAAVIQSIASDDQIIMDHVKAAHEIAKVVRRQA